MQGEIKENLEIQADQDAFFGYENTNDDDDDSMIIPAQQSVGIMAGVVLDSVINDVELDVNRGDFNTGTSITQSTVQPRAKGKKPVSETKSRRRGNYVDMNMISQSQQTATFMMQNSLRPPRKKSRRNRRKRRQNEETLASSYCESEMSRGSNGEYSTMSEEHTAPVDSVLQNESQRSIMMNEGDSQACEYSRQTRGVERRKRRRLGRSSRSSRSSARRSSEDSCGDDSEHTGRGDSGNSREKFVASKLIEKERKRVQELIKAQEMCFACMWGRQDYAKVDKEDIDLLENFFRARYGKMNRKAFCAVMQKLYRVNIQEPYRKRGLKLPEWSKEMIEEHLLYHDMDPELVFTEVLHTFFTTFMEIQNSFFIEKKEMVKETDPHEVDPSTGEPLEYEYEITKWIPDTRNIRCGIEVAKAMEQFFKLSNAEFAPERKRTRVKNLSPSLVNADRVYFSNIGND